MERKLHYTRRKRAIADRRRKLISEQAPVLSQEMLVAVQQNLQDFNAAIGTDCLTYVSLDDRNTVKTRDGAFLNLRYRSEDQTVVAWLGNTAYSYKADLHKVDSEERVMLTDNIIGGAAKPYINPDELAKRLLGYLLEKS